MRLAVLAILACCAPRGSPPTDEPGEQPRDRTRRYTIWLGGARVGTAIEREVWSRDGVHLSRDERLQFRRGDAEIQLATAIVIDADPALVARYVQWTERGSDVRSAEAWRGADGWRVSTGDPLAANAVPAELVPLLVRRDGRFAGTVFLPARGFVAGRGRIDAVAPGRLIARVALEAGAVVEATIDLDRDGMPIRVVDGDGVIAIRATEAQAAAAFRAVDLIAATAIPIAGTRRSNRLVLTGARALPALPGQLARASPGGVNVELGAALAGALPGIPADRPPDGFTARDRRPRDRADEIRALVAAVHRQITPDLAAAPASTHDAAAATAGDCTTFALAYAALAGGRGIVTRVVTGLRVDGARLIRHRWAVSWSGHAWIAIDAAFGAVPAGGDLIGLAVHGADDAGLVAGEAALAQVRAAAWE